MDAGIVTIPMVTPLTRVTIPRIQNLGELVVVVAGGVVVVEDVVVAVRDSNFDNTIMKNILALILIMGFFSNLLGQSKSNDSHSSSPPELRLEYNVMKNISLVKLKKYENSKRYKLVEEGIYLDLKDKHEARYRMTLSYELESDQSNNQYPLEDILDKYLMHVSDFLESKNKPNTNKYIFEFGGYLDKMMKAKEIIEKKVFNRDFMGTDGKVYTDLVIE